MMPWYQLWIAWIDTPAIWNAFYGPQQTTKKKTLSISDRLNSSQPVNKEVKTMWRVIPKSTLDDDVRWAVHAIANWAKEDVLVKTFPALNWKRNIVTDLMSDVEWWADEKSLIEKYPELSPKAIKDISMWKQMNKVNMTLDDRVNSLTQEEYNNYKQKFIDLKNSWSKLYNLYRVPEWDNAVSRIINAARWKYKDVWFENELMWYIYEQEKDFKDIAMKDLWAYPSVVWWAVSSPAKMVWWAVDLWAKAIWKKTNLNDSIDKITEKLWIEQDGRYDAGKIATDIWLSTMWVNAIMWWVTKLSQVSNLVSKYPKIAKYITKPILEWIWYQWASDISKWELSSKSNYLTSAALSAWFSALGWLLWWITRPRKYMQDSVKNVSPEYLRKISKMTDEFKNWISADNPLQVSAQKITNLVDDIGWEKWIIWKKIWDMRKTLKTINYSTQDAVDKLNSAFKNNEIAANIKKVKWTYKVIWWATKSEWKNTILKEIVSEINSLKELWTTNKLAWLDKINQNIKYLIKTSKMEWSLNNALWKTSSEFTKYIDEVLDWYWIARWEYGKLAEITTTLKTISEEWWSKWINALRKMYWPEWIGIELKKSLKELKDMWLLKDDILWEIVATNYIMSSKLSPSQFQQAINNVYPSQPWLLELWIRWVQWLIKKPVKNLIKAAWWWNKAKRLMQSTPKQSFVKSQLPDAVALTKDE